MLGGGPVSTSIGNYIVCDRVWPQLAGTYASMYYVLPAFKQKLVSPNRRARPSAPGAPTPVLNHLPKHRTTSPFSEHTVSSPALRLTMAYTSHGRAFWADTRRHAEIPRQDGD